MKIEISINLLIEIIKYLGISYEKRGDSRANELINEIKKEVG